MCECNENIVLKSDAWEINKCEYCGKEFTALRNKKRKCCSKVCARNNQVKDNKLKFYEVKKCKLCDKEFEALKKRKQEFCSNKCSTKYYGNDVGRLEKRKSTNKERYGVEHAAQSKDIQEKIKKTCLERYGVENGGCSQQAIEKIKNNNLIKYGGKVKIKKDNIKKVSIIPQIKIENGNNTDLENEIYNSIIKIINGDNNLVIRNDTTIINSGISIYIPSKKLAIEFDGLLWHSENFGKKDRRYHLNKTRECEKLGIQLIHVFEDEWMTSRSIVENRISHIMGCNNTKTIIHARKCKIKEIESSEECRNFLNTHHLQGNVPSNVKLGAYYNDKLVAVMTFGKLRSALGNKTISDNEYELYRFAVDGVINGIGSRLLKYFINKYSPKRILTFADRRYSFKGAFYTNLGFKFIGETDPNYWYFKIGELKRYHRYKFRKSELNKLLQKFDNSLSEFQNMVNNGYDRIWDCGNFKYELNF